MGAVEQHRSHGPIGVPIGLPIGLPVIETGIGGVRVIDRRARQRCGSAGIVATQVSTGQAVIKSGHCPGPLAQEVPQALAVFGRNGAQAAEFGSGRSSPGTRIRVTPRSANHQALNTVAPIADAAAVQ